MEGRLEREFKLALPSEDALNAVMARLGGASGPPVRQVNHFLDTRGRALRSARLALRVREEEGSFTLTLKGPAQGATGAESPTTRPEEELDLTPEDARRILEGTLEPLTRLASTPLVRRAIAVVGTDALAPIGSFVNERQRIGPLEFPPGSSAPVVIELDRTRYPGGRVERELEVEIPDDSLAAAVGRGLRELFQDLGLPLVTPPSKAARLFRILDPVNQEVPGTRPPSS